MALFTVAEARAFDPDGTTPLADPLTYPDVDISAAADRITEDFAAICGVSFVPVTETDRRYDGSGTPILYLDRKRLTSVTACTVYSSDGSVYESFDADDLADLALYDTGQIVRRRGDIFLAGYQNVSLTYVHGYTSVPAPIKLAALRLAVWQLVPNNVDQRLTALTADGHTFALATAGRRGSWYGLPEVDSVLQRYSRPIPII